MRYLTCIALIGILAGCVDIGELTRAHDAIERDIEYVQPVVPANKAIVFFYSPQNMYVGGFIYANGLPIVVIRPETFSYAIVDPKTYVFDMRSTMDKVSATLDIEAGGEYYIKYIGRPGGWAHINVLENVAKETGQAAIPTMEYIRMNLDK